LYQQKYVLKNLLLLYIKTINKTEEVNKKKKPLAGPTGVKGGL
jgi:hypothetical protein